MMPQTTLIASLLLAATLPAMHAQGTTTPVWEDDFSSSRLDPLFLTYNSTPDWKIDQSGGRLIFTGAPVEFDHANIYTQAAQTGETGVGNTGVSVFDFFSRRLEITLSDVVFSTTPPVESTYDFFAFVGISTSTNAPKNHHPRGYHSGVSIRISLNSSDVYSLIIGDRADNISGSQIRLRLFSRPESVILSLDGQKWTARVTGTTFEDGKTAYSGTFGRITKESLGASPYFSMGLVNYSTITDSAYVVSIDKLTITAN